MTFTLAAFFSLLLNTNPVVGASETKTVQIGIIFPEASTNDIRAEQNALGLKDYFRYVNETVGGISGRKIVLRSLNHFKPDEKPIEAIRSWKVIEKACIVATGATAVSIEAKAIFRESKIPQISFSNAESVIFKPMDYTYLAFGSSTSSYLSLLQYITTIKKQTNKPQIGILSSHIEIGKRLKYLCQSYAAKGLLHLSQEVQIPQKASNLFKEMQSFKNKGVDYILFEGSPAVLVMALKAANEIEYTSSFLADWTCVNDNLLLQRKNSPKNHLFISFPGCVPGEDNAGMRLINTLLRKYRPGHPFSIAYWEGVAVAAIMARGVQRAYETLGKIDGQTVNLALETFEKEDFGGLIPRLTYTDSDHEGFFVTRVLSVNKNQTFTPVTRFWNPKEGTVNSIP